MDPKLAPAGAPDEKLSLSYRDSDLSPEDVKRAPGGMDFIADKNRIDEVYHLPVNDVKKSTW